MQTPIRRSSMPADAWSVALRLLLLVALLLLVLGVVGLLSSLPQALAQAQHGLNRFAVQLLLELLERFAPQLGSFV